MTRDEIIRMAREAGMAPHLGHTDDDGKHHPAVNALKTSVPVEWLERFTALVAEAERAARIAAQTEAVELKERLARSGVEERRAVAAEREACALVADATFRGKPGQSVNLAVAAAIRARGAAMKTRIAIGWATYRLYRQCTPLPVALRVAWRAIKRG